MPHAYHFIFYSTAVTNARTQGMGSFKFTLGWSHLITFGSVLPSSFPSATHDLIRNLPQDCREMSLPLLLLQYSLFLTYMLSFGTLAGPPGHSSKHSFVCIYTHMFLILSSYYLSSQLLSMYIKRAFLIINQSAQQ